MTTREKLYNIIDRTNTQNGWSKAYRIFMLSCITINLIPLVFRTQYDIFRYIEIISTTIYIIDYLLRWATADLKLSGNRYVSFIRYPLTPFALIDLLSIFAGIDLLHDSFRVLRVSRLFAIVVIFKYFRYSKEVSILYRVLYKERKILFSVFLMAIFYIITTALIMFNIESGGKHFMSFFDALYWATTTLTTVGYGDIYPYSDAGRVISMISALFGVAIIALPSGIITAGYLDELRKNDDKK